MDFFDHVLFISIHLLYVCKYISPGATVGFLNHLDTSSGQFTTTCLEIAQHKLRRSLVGGPKTALSLPNKKALQFSHVFF